jgi:hypothetical protein
MSEIKPAERIVLDVLRQTTLAKMSDADFANLEAEVARKGLRNVDGWLGTQMRKAVEQVLKHPGHGDQSVHGGGRGKGGAGSAGGDDSVGNPSAAQSVSDDFKRKSDEAYARGDKKMGESYEHKARGASDVAKAPDKASAEKIVNTAASREVDYKSKGAMELGTEYARRGDGAWDAYKARFGETPNVEKAVEPVVKHPGHADQSVHGGARRKGGAPSSAPASAGGGTGGKFEAEPDDVGLGKPKSDANSRRKESEAADKVGYGANQAAENMGAHSNEMAQKIYGKDGASKRMTDIDEVELMQISDSLGSVAESLTRMSSPKMEGQYKEITRARRQLKEVRSDAMRNLSPAVRPIAVATIDKHIGEVDSLLRTHREAWTGVGGVFEKAVEPVTKHPGHGDQSVHGGGRRGGGASGSANKPPQGTAVFDNEQNMSQTELQASRTASMKTGVEGSAHKGKWEVSNTGSAEIYFGSGNPVNKLGESHFAIVGVQKVKLGGGANPKPYTVEVTKLSRKNGGLSGGTRKRAEFASVEEAFAAVDKLIGQQPSFSSSEVLGR